jgi:hypothetical protein
VLAWGFNYFGQLGNGTTSAAGCYCISTPVQVSLPSGAPQASRGHYQPTGGLPSGKRATGVITTSSASRWR